MEDYSEEYYYESDITFGFGKTGIDALYPDGCDFNKSAIVCPPKRRYAGQCDKCGWNPRVARRRSYLIRKKLEEEANATD